MLPTAHAAATCSALLLATAYGDLWMGVLPSTAANLQANPPRSELCSLWLPCRLTQWLRILPILPRLPVSVYLVQQSNSTSWGLIDAGLPDSPRQPHATQLLAAVRAAIPPGHQLTAIVCE